MSNLKDAIGLNGILACPDCRARLEWFGHRVGDCPGCGRSFDMAGRAPVMHPRRSGSESEGRRFFIDEPGKMEQLRRKHPGLARRLEIPDFTAPVKALPLCAAWFQSRVVEGRPGERILNLGSGVHKQYANERLLNFDIAPHDNADVVGDGERLPFRDDAFDGVLLDAVVEHLAHPHRVVAEVNRVLKPGGIVLAQVPFLYPFHAAPHDYQRYTPAGLRMLFEEFELIEAGTDRRPGRAVLEIMTAYAALWSDNRSLSYALRLLTAWAWLPVKFFDPWLSKKNKAEYVAASASILARKRGGPA